MENQRIRQERLKLEEQVNMCMIITSSTLLFLLCIVAIENGARIATQKVLNISSNS